MYSVLRSRINKVFWRLWESGQRKRAALLLFQWEQWWAESGWTRRRFA